MRPNPTSVSLLAFAVLAGCATPPPTSRNPFDESLYSAPAALPRGTDQVKPAAPPTLVAPQKPNLQPVESDVQVFALGDTPDSIVAESSLHEDSLQPTGADGAVPDILQESARVAGLGDIDGQISLLEQAGSMGSDAAYYSLARIYLTGAGVEKSPDTAVGYLTRAINLGNVEAERVLGWLYVMGSGVSMDVAYGKTLLAKAAETSIRAQREFGMALTNQRVPHLNDMERGLDYLRTASAAGDDEAAVAYSRAFSLPAEPENKVGSEQMRPGAMSNSPPATLSQGSDLEARGRAGDVTAMYQYALNVSLGRTRVNGDPQFIAYCWYAAAAARGFEPARAEVRSLAGVRTLADRKSPGMMDACIAGLNPSETGE